MFPLSIIDGSAFSETAITRLFEWPRVSDNTVWNEAARGGLARRTLEIPNARIASGGAWLVRVLSSIVLELPRALGRSLPRTMLQVR